MAIKLIRKSQLDDIPRIMEIFGLAKKYMREQGNPTQWNGEYPDVATVTEDIVSGTSYVGEDETGKVVMVFTLIIGEDPTYKVIRKGEWLNNEPYGTIHRIASDGSSRGVLKSACEFSFSLIDTLRIDTHEDNIPMQRALNDLGFIQCGEIICRNGTERIAFQSPGKKNN